MNKIHLVMPYYRNQKMLLIHIKNWKSYTQEVRDNLKITIIDDGSPVETAIEVLRENKGFVPRGLDLYYIEQDIPWNQHGARNLGAFVAEDNDWLLMTDMDRIIPLHSIENLMSRTLDKSKFYKFLQLSMSKNLPKSEPPHINTFLITKENFWKANGYDEDYCGTYGGDGQFIQAIKQIAKLEILRDVFLLRYYGAIVSDATTQNYERDPTSFRLVLHKKQMTKNIIAKNPLRFSWKKLDYREI